MIVVNFVTDVQTDLQPGQPGQCVGQPSQTRISWSVFSEKLPGQNGASQCV